MPRRRSVYSLPKLKLKQKTIVSVGTIVAFVLAGLSAVSLFTDSLLLGFWSKFLIENLGWTAYLAFIGFLLTGLVLQRVKWGFAQLNVLLGFVLIIISLLGLTASISLENSGVLGVQLWSQLDQLVSPLGAIVLLMAVFFVGIIVLFNTSLSQI